MSHDKKGSNVDEIKEAKKLMSYKKHKRRTKEDKARLRKKFIEKCCFKKKPTPTEDIFKILGLDYSNSNEQQFGYKLISKWVGETIDKYWDFSIVGVDIDFMENKYREFLEKCWLDKYPFGYFVDGLYYTPEKYVQWNNILNRIFVSHFIGARTSLEKMADKGMLVNSRLPAYQLLESVNNYSKLLEMCNDESKIELIAKLLTLNDEFNTAFNSSLPMEIKKGEKIIKKKDEIIEITEEIKENSTNDNEIDAKLKKMEHDISKMRLEIAKKQLKDRVENNEEK